MKLKPSPPDISAADPFSSDALDRKESADFLTTIVTEVETPFVLCLDSPWGTGKTTFLKMWAHSLSDAGVEALYFNSWTTDFAEDPLLAFVSEILELIDRRASDIAPGHGETIKNVKRVASLLARRALPAAGKLATAGLLDLEEFQEDVLSGLVERTIKDAADAYLAEKALIEKFHTEIGKLIGLLGTDDEPARLVVLVDELDRCRPNYAIELLERIKHLLDVDNVVFVLALDKSQIQVSLEAIYGAGINTAEYLRRFIDLEFSLPSADSEKFTKYLFDKFEFNDFFGGRTHSAFTYDASHIEKSFVQLSELFSLSLRAREQCFSRIKLAMNSTPSDYHIYPMLLTALVVLRAVQPAIYDRFVREQDGADQLMEHLSGRVGGAEFLDTHPGRIIEASLIAAKSEYGRNANRLDMHRKIADDTNQSEVVRERSAFIVRVIDEMRMQDKIPKLNYLLSKIELVSRTR